MDETIYYCKLAKFIINVIVPEIKKRDLSFNNLKDINITKGDYAYSFAEYIGIGMLYVVNDIITHRDLKNIVIDILDKRLNSCLQDK